MREHTSFVLGYHGCDRAVGIAALNCKSSLKQSEKDYDWLGSGVYFWENDAQRALDWAKQKCRLGHYEHPFVIGAVIDLGNCLDLISRQEIPILAWAHDSLTAKLTAAGKPDEMPVNKDARGDVNGDKLLRFLDCAVINHLHYIIDEAGDASPIPPYDSVRGLFTEGEEVYPGARFLTSTHTQIAVRNMSCLKGYFLPPTLNQIPDDDNKESLRHEKFAFTDEDWGGISFQPIAPPTLPA
jgi:hypothetical protein